MNDDAFKTGTIVYSKDAKIKGRLTGSSRCCRMEGCLGRALGVKWDDGKVTYPCTKGMTFRKKTWRIG